MIFTTTKLCTAWTVLHLNRPSHLTFHYMPLRIYNLVYFTRFSHQYIHAPLLFLGFKYCYLSINKSLIKSVHSQANILKDYTINFPLPQTMTILFFQKLRFKAVICAEPEVIHHVPKAINLLSCNMHFASAPLHWLPVHFNIYSNTTDTGKQPGI